MYAYDSANRLVSVANSSMTAAMIYNGLGQRVGMDAAGVVTQYVMDGNNPLTATSNGNDTTYLYGLGVVAEQTTTWAYGLPDGTNSQRQLTDADGKLTYSARYTPWGDTLETSGAGNFAFGYFGGLMDEATGLMYVGNGRYYDPATGRFFNRDAKPNQSNPYVPFDPMGAMFAPLGLLAVIYGRKKKGGTWGVLLVIIAFAMVSGMALSACNQGGGGGSTSTPNETSTRETPIPTSTPTATSAPPSCPYGVSVSIGANGLDTESAVKDPAIAANAYSSVETMLCCGADAWVRNPALPIKLYVWRMTEDRK
jgi:RHS repeat-associated protein